MSYTPDASPFSDPISQEAYPAWSSQRQIPMSAEEVEDIFFDLQQKFGFQRDSMRNMVRLFTFAPAPPALSIPRNPNPAATLQFCLLEHL